MAVTGDREKCLRGQHATLTIYVPFKAAAKLYVSRGIDVQRKNRLKPSKVNELQADARMTSRSWRTGLIDIFPDQRISCALHKNYLDRCSRAFYISVVLRCSEISAGLAKTSLLAARSPASGVAAVA
jgi:phage protein D